MVFSFEYCIVYISLNNKVQFTYQSSFETALRGNQHSPLNDLYTVKPITSQIYSFDSSNSS